MQTSACAHWLLLVSGYTESQLLTFQSKLFELTALDFAIRSTESTAVPGASSYQLARWLRGKSPASTTLTVFLLCTWVKASAGMGVHVGTGCTQLRFLQCVIFVEALCASNPNSCISSWARASKAVSPAMSSDVVLCLATKTASRICLHFTCAGRGVCAQLKGRAVAPWMIVAGQSRPFGVTRALEGAGHVSIAVHHMSRVLPQ